MDGNSRDMAFAFAAISRSLDQELTDSGEVNVRGFSISSVKWIMIRLQKDVEGLRTFIGLKDKLVSDVLSQALKPFMKGIPDPFLPLWSCLFYEEASVDFGREIQVVTPEFSDGLVSLKNFVSQMSRMAYPEVITYVEDRGLYDGLSKYTLPTLAFLCGNVETASRLVDVQMRGTDGNGSLRYRAMIDAIRNRIGGE